MRTSLLIISILLVTFTSCKKIKKLTNFYLDYETEINVNTSQQLNNDFSIWTFKIQKDSITAFSENNSNIESTETVELYSLGICLVSPENGNLDFIDKVEVLINAVDQEQKKIAWIDSNPTKGLTSFKLNISDDDIKAYVIDNQFVFHIYIVTNTNINIDNLLKLKSSFFITTYLTDI